MPLVSGRVLLEGACELGIAVGGFSLTSQEILKAVLETAREEDAPLFIQVPSNSVYTAELVRSMANSYRIPISLQLVGFTTAEEVLSGIRHGCTSAWVDLSGVSLEEAEELLRHIVSLSAPLDVSVEAIVDIPEGIKPSRLREFTLRTGITALCIKPRAGEPSLDLNLIREVKENTGMPLVLSGVSAFYYEYVAEINRYGGEVKDFTGIPDGEVRTAVGLGINKVDVKEDLNVAFISEVRRIIAEEKGIIDPEDLLKPAVEKVKEVVRRKIRLLNSSGTAPAFRRMC